MLSLYYNPGFETCAEYCFRGLQSLGHECIAFNDRGFLLPGRLRSRLKFLQNWDLKNLNKNLVRLCIEKKAEICFVLGGDRITEETIKILNAMGIITVLWTTDPPRYFDAIAASAPFYHRVFCAGSEAQNILYRRRTDFLPFAVEPQTHYSVELTEEEKAFYGNDICFVGSHYANREEILSKIADMNIGIWGPGWDKVPDSSPLKNRIRRAADIVPQEWIKIISASKIAVAIHYHDRSTVCFQVSPKVYESMACGAMVISDDQKDIEKVFVKDKEIITFSDVADLRNKIEKYLRNDKLRKDIADAGMIRTVSTHTYKQRMRHMMEIVLQKGTIDE